MISWHRESNYRPEYERMMKESLVARYATDFYPTLFITISLYDPKAIVGRHDKGIRESQSDELFKEVMNRLDAATYGSNYSRLAEKDMFRFIFRIETKTRGNTRTMPHMHILGAVDGHDLDNFFRRKEVFSREVIKVCEQLGYDPDVDVRPHGAGFSDYILKYPLADIENIRFRRSYRRH